MLNGLIDYIVFRPGLLLALSLICVSLAALSGTKAAFVVLIVLITLIAILFSRRILRHRLISCFSRSVYCLAYLLCLIFGLYNWQLDQHRLLLSAKYAGSSQIVNGTVISQPKIADYGKARISAVIRTDDSLLVRVAGPAAGLAGGSTIRAVAELSQPSVSTNPGGYDARRSLSDQGIYLEGRISESAVISHRSPTGLRSFYQLFYTLRKRLYEAADRILPKTESALLTALLTGDDSMMSSVEKTRFRRAGLAHLTSVSGAHVAFLLLPVSIAVKRLPLSGRQRMILKISILVCYGLITGWRTGVSRSAIMLCLNLFLQYKNKNHDSLNNLGIACFLMLIFDVQAVRQIGFWLSFGASASLICFSAPAGKWLLSRMETLQIRIRKYRLFDALLNNLVRAAAAAIIMQFTVTMLASVISHEIFWLSWLFNLPAIFTASIICFLGIIVMPLILTVMPAMAAGSGLLWFFGGILLRIIGSMLTIPLRILVMLSAAASACGYRTAVKEISLMTWTGVLLLVLLIVITRQLKMNVWQLSLLRTAAAVCLFCGMTMQLFTVVSKPEWQIYFVDVGQGDSTLFYHQSGFVLLVDGGPPGSGCYDLVPLLAWLGADKIDLAVMTHGHNDHYGGLTELIELGLVKTLALPWIFQSDELLSACYNPEPGSQDRLRAATEAEKVMTDGRELAYMLGLAESRSVQMIYLLKNDTISLFGAAELRVLAPDDSLSFSQIKADGNSASVIMEFARKDLRLLMLADMTAKTEQRLMTVWRNSDLIKVAHHGSGTATGKGFLEAVRPKDAVISVGINRYGHPDARVIDRLKQSNCSVWRTDQNGCIIVSCDKSDYQIKTWITK